MMSFFTEGSKKENTVLMETAAYYVARLYSGDMTAGEEAALQNWLDEDERHVAEFNAQVAVSEAYAAEADSFRVPELEDEQLRPSGFLFSEPRRFTAYAMAIAALLFVAVISVDVWDVPPQGSVIDTQYITEVGEQRTVELPDGSVITLNTDTILDVDFSGQSRVAVLKRGEAFFEIAKDKTRVFTVHAGSQTVTVLGTKFNIQKRGQEYTVAVVEGLVAVHPKGKLLESPVLEPATRSEEGSELAGQYRLKAGHVMTYKDKTDLVATSQVEDTSRYSQWSTGIVTFDDATLSDVVKELRRYTPKQIMIVDRDIESLQVSGVFHLRELDDVILGLEQAFQLQIIFHEDAILISGS